MENQRSSPQTYTISVYGNQLVAQYIRHDDILHTSVVITSDILADSQKI